MLRVMCRRAVAVVRPGLWGRLTHREKDGERGAFLVIASVASVLAIASTGLAVDLSKAVSTKRGLQGAVDLAALESVRALGDHHGQGNLGESTQQHAHRLAEESMGRNGFDTSVAGTRVDPVVLGVYDQKTRTFTPSADTSAQNAVEVTGHTNRNYEFHPGSRSYTATAIAALREQAGIAVGSFLARVDTSTSLLGAITGGFLGGSITAVGYTGLASGTVTLGQLRAELGLGTVNELLTTDVKLRDLALAAADAMEKAGDTASANLLRTQVVIDSNITLALGDLINVAQGYEDAAATASLNVLQLLQMGSQVADGDHFLSLNLASSSLAPLGGLLNAGGNTLSLQVIEPPQIAIGPAQEDPAGSGNWVTTARTAQIRAMIHLRPLSTVSILGIPQVLDLPVYLEAASATASLRDVDCSVPSALVHTDTEALRARVGNVTDAALKNTGTAPAVSEAVILNVINLVRVRASADQPWNITGQDLTFTGPFDWDNTQTVGSSSLALGELLNSNLNADIDLLGGLLSLGLGWVLGAVLGILAPIFNALDEGLLDPLLSALGVMVGGADVTNFSLECNGRTLVR